MPLPPRPLTQTPDGPNLWLLTLVDDRYFWWFKGAVLSITAGTTTWSQLYADLATALGVTIDVDTIPSAYLKPDADLALSYESLPTILDVVSFSVGQRIVRQLDGTVRAWNAAAARDAVTTQLDALPVTAKLAGGVYSLGLGGSDNAGVLPESVTTTFRTVDTVAGVLETDLTPYAITLASLALADFPGVTGFLGTKILHSSAIALDNGGILPTNNSELLALAGIGT